MTQLGSEAINGKTTAHSKKEKSHHYRYKDKKHKTDRELKPRLILLCPDSS